MARILGSSEGDHRDAAFQDGPVVTLGSVWLRLELVGTHVEGHRMIWKVNLWEGAAEAGTMPSMSSEPLPSVGGPSGFRRKGLVSRRGLTSSQRPPGRCA